MARGRLRVYLGAAPGVGKTYEMLLEGQRQRKQGVDCVIGFVEPHGRRATQELVDGLEVVSRRYDERYDDSARYNCRIYGICTARSAQPLL